jgi:hypothetical protein
MTELRDYGSRPNLTVGKVTERVGGIRELILFRISSEYTSHFVSLDMTALSCHGLMLTSTLKMAIYKNEFL